MAIQDRFRHNIKPVVPQDDEDSHSYDEDLLSDEQSGQESAEPSPSQDESEAEDTEAIDQRLNSVSFGALKKANETLAKKRKAGDEHGPDQEAKLESLRKRLQLIKDEKQDSNGRRKKQPAMVAAAEVEDDEDSDGSSSSAPEEISTKGRAKHAPASQSSRHQVSRKRQVIDVPKKQMRDPRFDTVRYAPTNTDPQEKAYSFLRDYQKSEMQELKAAMKKAKTQEDKDTLRRTLNAMENRLKAKEAKEREQSIVRKHRKQERDQIREGKTPYFLKRSEVKQQALVEKYGSMKSKDCEHLMERRRKKESQKEKRRMPELRRNIN